MKTVSTALNNAISTDLRVIDKATIYQQYKNKIIEVVGSSIVMSGDATSLFAIQDTIIFPLISFDNTCFIDSITYDPVTDKTTIVPEPSDYNAIGQYIAKVVNITEKLTTKSIESVKQGVEGKTYNEFDSGSISIIASNDAGYFKNKTKTGLLDDDSIFWVRYDIKFKGHTDSFNYFTGMVDLSECEPDLFNRVIKIFAYGHSYELERHPAFYLSNETDCVLPKINGIKIVGFVSSENTEEGIKKIYFKPFSPTDFKSITVDKVSANTLPGIKILEYKYPNLFRWDNGVWTAITSNPAEGIQKLMAKDAVNYAEVIVGTNDALYEFPTKDTEIWVLVNSLFNESTTQMQQGKPILTFDNGTEEPLKVFFQRILRKVSSTYTDVTQNVNDKDTSQVILSAINDEIIIVAPERFWGINFFLNALLATGATFTMHYSIGGELWSSDFKSYVTDETVGFTVNGKMKWNEIGNWAVNNLTPDVNTLYSGYMMKIVVTSLPSSVTVNTIKRVMRAQGENGDFIEFEIDIDKLSPKEIDDELIIKKDDADQWSFAVWYYSVTLNRLMNKFKSIAKYEDAKVINDALSFSLTEPTFNIWGRVPRFSYVEYPTAFYVDFVSGYIYIANKLEVYRSLIDGTGSWGKVFDLNSQGLTDTVTQYNHIYLIDINSNIVTVYSRSSLLRLGFSTHKFNYNLTTGILTVGAVKTGIYSGEWTSRYGQPVFENPNKERYIGWFTARTPAGENVCIPFPQTIECDEWQRTVAMYPTIDEKSNPTGFPEYYFDNTVTPQTLLFNAKMGFYAVQNNTLSSSSYPVPYNLTLRYGQKGCKPKKIIAGMNYNYAFFDTSIDNVHIYQLLSIEDAFVFPGTANWATITRHLPGHIPVAHCGDLATTSYWTWTEWKDFEGDKKSHSFISKTDDLKDWRYVASLDTSGNQVGGNMANAINAGGIVIDFMHDNNTSVVFAHQHKLKSIILDFSNTDAGDKVFEIYYWNGAAWVRKDDLLRSWHAATKLQDNYWCLDIPQDWGWHNTYGYAFRLKLVSGSAYFNLNNATPVEKVIWESRNEVGNEMQMITNMQLDSTNNVLMGSVFNRQTNHSYPFQWSLFTMDLTEANRTPDDPFFNPAGLLNIIRTGSNFTFEGTFSFNNFVYNVDDDEMYAYAENLRYKDVPGFLLKIKWNAGVPTVTRLGNPSETDYGCVQEMYYNAGKLFGITKGDNYYLWEYTKTFEPRIELARYDENDTLRTVLNDFAAIMNMHYIIHSERIIRFINRNTYNQIVSLEFDKHLVSKDAPIKPMFWKNKYDSVIVNWSSEITGKKGNKKLGFEGWNRKKFTLSNGLIQNKFLAKAVADKVYEYLSVNRINVEGIKSICIPWLENMDAIYIKIPNDIIENDSTTLYEIITIDMKSDKSMSLELLEVEPVS